MTGINKFFRVYAPLGISLISFTVVSIGIIFSRDWFSVSTQNSQSSQSSILGKSILRVPTQIAHFDRIVSPVVVSSRKIETTQEEYNIVLVSGPENVKDGYQASFTWYIAGPESITNISTIYFGATSSSGIFSNSIAPQDTQYTDEVKDFMNGNYTIPIQFVGNTGPMKQGTYFYRAYSFVGGKHYWTDEYFFTVQ